MKNYWLKARKRKENATKVTIIWVTANGGTSVPVKINIKGQP